MRVDPSAVLAGRAIRQYMHVLRLAQSKSRRHGCQQRFRLWRRPGAQFGIPASLASSTVILLLRETYGGRLMLGPGASSMSLYRQRTTMILTGFSNLQDADPMICSPASDGIMAIVLCTFPGWRPLGPWRRKRCIMMLHGLMHLACIRLAGLPPSFRHRLGQGLQRSGALLSIRLGTRKRWAGGLLEESTDWAHGYTDQ